MRQPLRVVSPNTIGCTRPKIAANATPSASNRIGVAHGWSRIAVVRIRNSLANTPNGGMPQDRERAEHQAPADGRATA